MLYQVAERRTDGRIGFLGESAVTAVAVKLPVNDNRHGNRSFVWGKLVNNILRLLNCLIHIDGLGPEVNTKRHAGGNGILHICGKFGVGHQRAVGISAIAKTQNSKINTGCFYIFPVDITLVIGNINAVINIQTIVIRSMSVGFAGIAADGGCVSL